MGHYIILCLGLGECFVLGGLKCLVGCLWCLVLNFSGLLVCWLRGRRHVWLFLYQLEYLWGFYVVWMLSFVWVCMLFSFDS